MQYKSHGIRVNPNATPSRTEWAYLIVMSKRGGTSHNVIRGVANKGMHMRLEAMGMIESGLDRWTVTQQGLDWLKAKEPEMKGWN